MSTNLGTTVGIKGRLGTSTTNLFRQVGDSDSPGVPEITLATKKAFPGAFGAGSGASINTSTATVYEVTNLNAYGAGSFKDALQQSGERIILIKVEGELDLVNLQVNLAAGFDGDFYVWGQFAPRNGLTVRSDNFFTNQIGNYVMRHITSRGDRALGCTVNVDCFDPFNTLRLDKGTSVYIDHCSFRYGLDQQWTLNINSSDPGVGADSRSTFAYNIMAEGDPAHNTGSIINTDVNNVAGRTQDLGNHTWARNFAYNVSHRFPNTNARGRFENFNNYIVNWSARLSRMNEPVDIDFHRNYMQAGQLTLGLASPTIRGNKLNQGNDWGSDEPNIFSAFNHIDLINTNTASNLQSDIYTWFDTESETYYGVPVTQDGPVPTEFFTTTQQFSWTPPQDGYWTAAQTPAKARSGCGHNRGINADGSPWYGNDDKDADYISKAANNATTESTYRSTASWDGSTFSGESLYSATSGDYIPDWFKNQHSHLTVGVNQKNGVHTNWDFGTFTVVNTAGYTNLEMCAAFYAGDFQTIMNGENSI